MIILANLLKTTRKDSCGSGVIVYITSNGFTSSKTKYYSSKDSSKIVTELMNYFGEDGKTVATEYKKITL